MIEQNTPWSAEGIKAYFTDATTLVWMATGTASAVSILSYLEWGFPFLLSALVFLVGFVTFNAMFHFATTFDSPPPVPVRIDDEKNRGTWR
jgi:hypothetical protein